MLDKVLKDCLTLGLVTMAGIYGFNKILDYKEQKAQAQMAAASQNTPTASTGQISMAAPIVKQSSSATVSIRKTVNGQYWTQARVNGGFVNFLVDTGASTVALTATDALKAGIKPHQLNYNRPVQTAGGQIQAAAINLQSVSVGGITLRNIDAMVIKDEFLHTSLLGMSFLGELQKVEATRDSLILRL